MPLTIHTDIPNTTDETNNEHYNLAILMMATGVPTLRKDNAADLSKFLSRVLLMDLMPSKNGKPFTTPEFVAWVRQFGNVHTNANKRTDTDILKSVREVSERVARAAVEHKEDE